jgi:guanine deaminase
MDSDLITDAIRFLDRAIDLALQNADAGRAPFGALVVRDGHILGSGVNTVDRDTDPFAHAEVVAMQDAARRLGTPDLSGAVVVSSCEPCVLCRAAASTAGAVTTIHAATRHDVPQPEGSPNEHALRLARLADALDAASPDEVVHVASPRTSEPFTRYLDIQAGEA